MSSSEPMEFLPAQISILEWYDGVVRGIAESPGKSYLFTLAAWGPGSATKAYLLIDVDLATAGRNEIAVQVEARRSGRRGKMASV